MQGRTHDGYEEAVVEVVQELGADEGMSHLHHGVAELQRVHEQHQRRDAHPVLPPQGVPVVPSDLDLPGQRRVEGAEACGQHLNRDQAQVRPPTTLTCAGHFGGDTRARRPEFTDQTGRMTAERNTPLMFPSLRHHRYSRWTDFSDSREELKGLKPQCRSVTDAV